MNYFVEPVNHLSANHFQIVVFFFAFALVFYGCFFILGLLSKVCDLELLTKKSECLKISMRVTSSVHASTVTLLAIWNLLTNDELHKNKLIFISRDVSFNLNIVMGYMTFDILIMMIYDELRELIGVFHHFVSVSAFYACSNMGVFSFIAIARLTSEGSTTFINIRFLLLAFQKKDSLWYTINGVCVLVAFGVFRILPIIPIWYTFYAGLSTPEWDQIHAFYKVLCVITSLPLDILNVYWFNLIFQKVIDVIKNGDSEEIIESKDQ